MEQQGTVNNRTFVLFNFRSIIPALTILGILNNIIYIYGWYDVVDMGPNPVPL